MFWILLALAGWVFAGIGWYRAREIRLVRERVKELEAAVGVWEDIYSISQRRKREEVV